MTRKEYKELIFEFKKEKNYAFFCKEILILYSKCHVQNDKEFIIDFCLRFTKSTIKDWIKWKLSKYKASTYGQA